MELRHPGRVPQRVSRGQYREVKLHKRTQNCVDECTGFEPIWKSQEQTHSARPEPPHAQRPRRHGMPSKDLMSHELPNEAKYIPQMLNIFSMRDIGRPICKIKPVREMSWDATTAPRCGAALT